MRKLLLYFAVAIVVIFCGVSIYYVVRNDEVIYSTSQTKNIYINIDETMQIPVVHERPNKNTKLTAVSNSESVLIDEEAWTFTANEPGTAMITVTSSNKDFGPFEIIVSVGNGSVDCPYYIRNEQDLRNIGKGKWAMSDNYQLVNDIYLTEEFSPIGIFKNDESFDVLPFSGKLDGTLERFSINNLRITDTSSVQDLPAGLFAVIGEQGCVENIEIVDSSIRVNSKFAGIIAGRNYGLIGKCGVFDSVIENINTENGYTGIVCGLNQSKTSYAQVSLCTTEAEIISYYVGGGLVGYNRGGVISNNFVHTYSAKMRPSEQNFANSLFGGLVGFTMNGTEGIKSSIITNNLVVIDNIIGGGASVGGVFGETLAEDAQSRGYYSMLIYNSAPLISAVGNNIYDFELLATGKAKNYSKNVSKSEIHNPQTYIGVINSTWDLKNIWSVTADRSIKINYNNDSINYQELPFSDNVFEISDSNSLKEAIKYMQNFPSASVTYKIMGESEVKETTDENGQLVEEIIEKTYSYSVTDDWEPIGTKENPFQGKIVAEKDATITIKGLNVKDKEYAGFFGIVGQNAVVNNLKLIGVSLSGSVVGAVAGHNNGGIIENCFVQGGSLTPTKYAGGIAGFNNGVIKNSTAESLIINLDVENENNIYLGGIAGKTKGNIENSISSYNSINVNIESTNNTICIGGVTGFVEDALILSTKVEGFKAVSHKYLSRTYGGGIVGYATNSTIRNCGVTESTNIDLNSNIVSSIGGGIAGFLGAGKVLESSVGSIVLDSFNSAGLVSFVSSGSAIEESYVGLSSMIEGKYVGGLTCNLYGKIENAYTLANLKGSEIEAGMTTYLWQGASISYVYTYCAYSDEAKKAYAQTSSPFEVFQIKDKFGKITNSIVVVSDMEELPSIELFDMFVWKVLSRDNKVEVEIQINFLENITCNFCYESGLIGSLDNYALLKTLGFDKNIWKFDDTQFGNSPVLNDAFDSGFASIPVSDDSTEEEVA